MLISFKPSAWSFFICAHKKSLTTKHLLLIVRLLSFEERMPSAYFEYVKAFVTMHMVLYRRPDLPSAFEQIQHRSQKGTHNRTVKANTLHIGINLTAHHLRQTLISHSLQNTFHDISQHRLRLQQA